MLLENCPALLLAGAFSSDATSADATPRKTSMGTTEQMRQLQAEPGAVHLWVVLTQATSDASLLRKYRGLLTADERMQEGRFRDVRDRHRYLLTRALVRTTFSRYLSSAPEGWRFIADEFGRPHVENRAAIAAGLSFNISHTRDVTVLAITLHHQLGVDVETLGNECALLAVTRCLFAKTEADALYSLPPNQRGSRFLTLWTLKEAYIKARGEGLSLPLGQFGFELDDAAAPRFWASPELDTQPDGWRFWQFTLMEAHLVAVCVARMENTAQQLIARVVVPGVSERRLDFTIMRTF